MDAWLTEKNDWGKEMKAVHESMEAKIGGTNEKFEVIQGTFVSQMDIHQARAEAIPRKNRRQPKGSESRPRTHLK
jgi:hypothetical protein